MSLAIRINYMFMNHIKSLGDSYAHVKPVYATPSVIYYLPFQCGASFVVFRSPEPKAYKVSL